MSYSYLSGSETSELAESALGSTSNASFHSPPFSSSRVMVNYDREYSALSVPLTRYIHSEIPGLRGEKRREKIREANRELSAAEALLEDMQSEISLVPQTKRGRVELRLRSYRNDLQTLKRDLQRVCESSEGQDSTTDYQSAVDIDDVDANQRSRLLAGMDRLEESSRRLHNSHRLALETEALGMSTLSGLHGQREQLLRTGDVLMEGEVHLDRADMTLKEMARRMFTNKLINYGMLLTLLAIFLLLIYMKLA
ncbi:V-snare-domain-containing protein [Basidiobolus meristosporus CBS 931.73]|uniref:V-snare-domain-containing protein n=1 Tax=Basidiobolus meristosporus CBS 931.73 TaxID=1314790 RepID=A0A1Y1Y2E5_9FUNG|nr:V-snare-domain-containing protein [Basidiobolus meristosporus CBS 931.73]|eukprot:ORX92158.1 V-snare-domain-containing protein [Basidiobolus meristosporus CBS 931.73]